jgi:hypothetical protein
VGLVLVVVGFCLAGYLAGRLTAASGRALVVGVALVAALLVGSVVIGPPWLVLAAVVGLVPGYVRGSRRAARQAPTHIDLRHTSWAKKVAARSASHQVSPSVTGPARGPQQQTQS